MPDQPAVADMLRDWRRLRKVSQLELASRADISQRHLSFIENGRTIPSSAMVLRLAEHLDVPLRERIRLLVAAGHAPVFRHSRLEDPDFGRIRRALERILTAYEPYPAVALDSRWNILLASSALSVFLDRVDPALLRPPVNMNATGLPPGRSRAAGPQSAAGARLTTSTVRIRWSTHVRHWWKQPLGSWTRAGSRR